MAGALCGCAAQWKEPSCLICRLHCLQPPQPAHCSVRRTGEGEDNVSGVRGGSYEGSERQAEAAHPRACVRVVQRVVRVTLGFTPTSCVGPFRVELLGLHLNNGDNTRLVGLHLNNGDNTRVLPCGATAQRITVGNNYTLHGAPAPVSRRT